MGSDYDLEVKREHYLPVVESAHIACGLRNIDYRNLDELNFDFNFLDKGQDSTVFLIRTKIFDQIIQIYGYNADSGAEMVQEYYNLSEEARKILINNSVKKNIYINGDDWEIDINISKKNECFTLINYKDVVGLSDYVEGPSLYDINLALRQDLPVEVPSLQNISDLVQCTDIFKELINQLNIDKIDINPSLEEDTKFYDLFTKPLKDLTGMSISLCGWNVKPRIDLDNKKILFIVTDMASDLVYFNYLEKKVTGDESY